MDSIIHILTLKPVLVGLHLGFAILGIDLLVWVVGEAIAESGNDKRMKFAAFAGAISFVMSWIIGGYYYVKFYGKLVKPVILKSSAPWAHGEFMEAKGDIFVLIVPLALTVLFITLLGREEIKKNNLRQALVALASLTAGLGLLIGLMGYIISASARWG